MVCILFYCISLYYNPMFIFQQETAIKINISSDARRTEKYRYLGSDYCISKVFYRASLMAQKVKNLPAMQKTQVWTLGWEDPLEKEMVTHSNILAWKIPWMEEPGRLQFMGSQKVRHNWATNTHFLKGLGLIFLPCSQCCLFSKHVSIHHK